MATADAQKIAKIQKFFLHLALVLLFLMCDRLRDFLRKHSETVHRCKIALKCDFSYNLLFQICYFFIIILVDSDKTNKNVKKII
jgi:hypothetical protein